MLNQLLKVSSGMCQQFVEDAVKISSVATYCRWGGTACGARREFSYELIGERILKIRPHLPKLLTNIKWQTLLRRCAKLLQLYVISKKIIKILYGLFWTHCRLEQYNLLHFPTILEHQQASCASHSWSSEIFEFLTCCRSIGQTSFRDSSMHWSRSR